MTAAFAVVLAATMPMAYAQTTQNAPATTGETGAASPGATVTTPGNMPATGNEAASGTANEAGGAANRQAEVHLGQGQMLFSKMNGAAVYDEQNKQIGDISNVVLDPNGKVAAVLIKSGLSPLGPLACNTMAPDEGNMYLLGKEGSPELKDRFLKPMVEGRVRSAFFMTEPADEDGDALHEAIGDDEPRRSRRRPLDVHARLVHETTIAG